MLHITQAEKDVCYILTGWKDTCYILHRLGKMHVTYKQAGKDACYILHRLE